jgi:hypothetical protein
MGKIDGFSTQRLLSGAATTPTTTGSWFSGCWAQNRKTTVSPKLRERQNGPPESPSEPDRRSRGLTSARCGPAGAGAVLGPQQQEKTQRVPIIFELEVRLPEPTIGVL